MSGQVNKWTSEQGSSHNAVWAEVAHRQADGREYHPFRWLAGMRVGGQMCEPAYSKIAYGQGWEWEEILRLPCQAALQDGRAGGISMSLDFFGTFLVKQKSTEKNYDPVIARFLSPDDYVQNPFFTQNYNRYSYALNNPLKYVDRSGLWYGEYDDWDGDDLPDDYKMPYWAENEDCPMWLDPVGCTPNWGGSGIQDFDGFFDWWGDSSGDNGPGEPDYFRRDDDRGHDPFEDYEHPNFEKEGIYGPWEPTYEPNRPAIKGASAIVRDRAPYTGFWGVVTYIWTGGIENGIKYNFKGEPIGIAPIMGNPPIPAFKGGSIFIKGFGNVAKNSMHQIKPNIFSTVGRSNFEKIVGSNPNITVVNGKIVLQGVGDGFKGKTYNTGLNAIDFLKLIF